MASRATKRWQNVCDNCGDTWYPRGRSLSTESPPTKVGGFGKVD